jgi:4-amino-4-deoxy-L-arabinose transferase-like glycosyltransferase
MLKKYILYLLLLIVTILPRIVFLDKVPVSINSDETHYVLNTKSFFLTGKDISGEVSPLDILLFHYPNYELMQSELTYFLEMPIFGPFGYSLAGLALPSALLGILTVGLIYLITKKLFNKKTAFLAGFLAGLNPWLIFVNRTSYESGIAIPFFLGFFYLLLTIKGWKILLVIPVALLAFYSYIGTKLIFVPFILLSVLYAYIYVNKGKYLKQYLLVFFFSLVLMIFFLFQLNQGGGIRTSEIITPNSPEISKQVNFMRETTIQNPLIKIVENKFVVYATVLMRSTFSVFSPNYLFAGTDYFFIIGIHGLFYYIDAVFLALGVIFIFVFNKRILILFSLLISLSILPQVLHKTNGVDNFTPHIVLVVPFLIMITAFGISRLVEYFKNKYYSNIFLGLLCLVYIFFFLNFFNAYFFRFPLQEGTFNIANRVLSKYITLLGNANYTVRVYSDNSLLNFEEFLFFSNSYNNKTVNAINKSLITENFVYKNISFVPCDYSDEYKNGTLFIAEPECGKNPSGKVTSIVQIKDSGVKYNIYDDKICAKFNLPRYVSNLQLSDLSIENLSAKKFCETFIISR